MINFRGAKISKILSLGFFLCAAFSGLRAQTAPDIAVTKIRDNFFRLTSRVPYTSNFLAYVAPDGVLLVDSGQLQTGPGLRDVLKTIAPANPKVRFLINTHAHIDHTGGNLALAGEPTIIGPDILRSTLRAYSYVLYEFPDEALPSVTFTDSMTVYFGGEIVKLVAVPGSHDQTDIMVHFIKSGVVCLGDISYGMNFPSIDAYTGDLLKYPEVIDRILARIPETAIIVSGHGRETSVAELRQFRNMIADTARLVREAVANGKSVETLQKEDALKAWAGYEPGGFQDRAGWISDLANAGHPAYRGSLVEELYHVLVKSDGEAAVAKYDQLKKDFPDQYPFLESQLSRVGTWLLKKGRTRDAVKLFGLSVREFPDSWSAYDDLAGACLKDGDAELARRNYEKSLTLNPKNSNAVEQLEKLRKK